MSETLFRQDIDDSPRALADTLDGLDAVQIVRSLLAGGARRIAAIGSGSSYFACATSAYLYDSLASPGACALRTTPAEEFGLYPLPLDPADALVGVSASGKVIDVVGLFSARKGRQRLIGITNELDSPLARAADDALLTRAGASRVPTSTKTFLASVLALDVLWLALLEAQGVSAARELRESLADLPAALEKAMRETSGLLPGIAGRLLACERFFVAGSGPSWPLAQEVALVLKEVAGLPAEPMQAREMIHGPTAIVDETVGVIVVNPRGRGEEAAGALLAQCAERGATTASIGAAPSDLTIAVDVPEMLSPLVLGGPLFALANELAVRRGVYSDHPAWESAYMQSVRPQG